MNAALARIPVSLAMAAAIHVGMSPPNPAAPKEQRKMRDGIMNISDATFVGKYAVWLHTIAEIAVIVAAQFPGTEWSKNTLALLLPNRDPNSIALNIWATLGCLIVLAGCGLRYWCYRELGRHFLFEVAILKDHKLITTGPYAYVRHPSYSGVFISYLGMSLFYPFAGSWLYESEIYKSPTAWLVLGTLGFIITQPFFMICRRLVHEDAIVAQAFGKEWKEWANKVRWRVIPGVF
ncbi:hypothetical protein BJ165DRAFT_1476653 [Panaeolus papilionaceus]|nr:hypothetical protein BJ165DRAFT_1476653 [Panaeolus papilionaceus]